MSNADKYNMHVESPYNITSSPWGGIFLPVFASHDIEEVHYSVKTAIVVIHGYTRNAADFFNSALEASCLRNDTFILAPYFSNRQISGSDWGNNSANDTMSLHWRTSNWMKGFSAGAQFLNRYAWASSIGLPTSVVEGGRMKIPADGQSVSTPAVRFILSDASSYLYLSPQRPDSFCRPLSSGDTFNDKCNSYLIPEPQYSIPLENDNGTSSSFNSTFSENATIFTGDVPFCTSYDSWKHGIAEIPSSGFNYLSKFAATSDGAENMKENHTFALSRKDLRFILGLDDVCNCNSMDFINNPHVCFHGNSDMINTSSCAPSIYDSSHRSNSSGDNNGNSDGTHITYHCCDTFPDSSTNYVSPRCEDMLQGSHRLQRGLLYTAYLERHLWAYLNYSSTVELVPEMAHNRTAFFKSEVFQKWAYAPAMRVNEEAIARVNNDDGADGMQFLTHVRMLVTVMIPLTLAMCVLFKYACIKRVHKGIQCSDDDTEWLSELSLRGGRGKGLPDVMIMSSHAESLHRKSAHGHCRSGSKSRRDTEREKEESTGLIGANVEDSVAVY